jgi:hypothetical protein
MQTSDWIAIGSAAISLASAGFTAFYARTQHKLNVVQLAEKEREAAERKVVTLQAELIKHSPQTWVVRITNKGKSTAYAVTVGCDKCDEVGEKLLRDEDIGEITPVPELLPGQHFDIKATNWHGMYGPQLVFFNWNDEVGGFGSSKVKVLVN